MKTFKELLEEEISKEEVLQELDDISEIAETELELSLLDLISSLIEEDVISSDAYDGIYDILDDLEEEIKYDDIELDEEILNEVRAAYRKRGYVKCPNGKIRKRGNCGKPLDKKRSRKLKRMRKTSKGKQAFRKQAKRALRTKKRTHMI